MLFDSERELRQPAIVLGMINLYSPLFVVFLFAIIFVEEIASNI